MDLCDQIFKAVDVSDFAALDRLFAMQTNEIYNPLFGIKHACNRQNLDAVRHILPYATKIFLNEKSPQDSNAIETMDPSPSAAFFEFMEFWVVPTKNLELFKIFVPLMLSNINLPANSQQCADILITCYNNAQLDMIDCILPFLNDLSGFKRSLEPDIGEFCEQRKAQIQRDTIMKEMDGNPPSYAQRKM